MNDFSLIEMIYKFYHQNMAAVLVIICILLMLSFLGVLKEGSNNKSD